MSIDSSILEKYPELNEQQKEVIGCLDGPLRVIAGPGSGKTYCIILRTLNLLLQGKAEPKQVILCTFTNKATFEMRDRLAEAARKIGFKKDLSELTVSTIHGFCNRLLMRHRHLTPLRQNYETLNELTEQLFLYEHFDAIFGERKDGKFLEKWSSKWGAIKEIRPYINKVADELISPEQIRAQNSAFLPAFADAYTAYKDILFERNRVDFAHLQMLAHDILEDPGILEEVTRDIRYVLVDEYQDTNYVQEQLLFKLTGQTGYHLCVVGDEDQSIYRFRGATVRNILEFDRQLPGCKTLALTVNYRSHRGIIEKYDRWMASANWTSRKNAAPFRHDKRIEPNNDVAHPPYLPVFSVWGDGQRNEATRVADLIGSLKKSGVISDYKQVALLLHSVRAEHSEHYITALANKGIPAYCPRARVYFYNEEICDMVACFAVIFGWHGAQRGEILDGMKAFAAYVDETITGMASRFAGNTLLTDKLRECRSEIESLREGARPGILPRPVDYVYRLLAIEPFATAAKDTNKARNLAYFSRLLNDFQMYYRYPVITHKNREFLNAYLFGSFFNFLFGGGINEYEDDYEPIPAGHVQVMTIHQAKGLEFSVVIAGSLSTRLRVQKQVDQDLGPCCHRPQFEPPGRITVFDRMRQHYVAFSRAQNLLVLSAYEEPEKRFRPIWDGLPQWPHVDKDALLAQRFKGREHIPLKKTYSFTNDIGIYETCPRQYQFFKEYDFMPSRSASIFFGVLVHQTIEEIHRIAMNDELPSLDASRIRSILEQRIRDLRETNIRPIGDVAKDAAHQQVCNYVRQNREEMQNIEEVEVDVSLEKDGYILAGKVDLIRSSDGALELLDFKTAKRPTDASRIEIYERQLRTYAHILEQRHGRRPERLTLYWTGEAKKEDALMTLSNSPQKTADAGRHFGKIVANIQNRKFAVARVPDKETCRECDMYHFCRADDTIPKHY